MIELAHGPLRAEVDPEDGASIKRLVFSDLGGDPGDDIDILAPAPEPFQPLRNPCYPVFPYFGRIRDGRFSVDSRDVVLERNVADQPHPLHGHGFLGDWSITARTPTNLQLHYDHTPDSWPWHYRAQLDYTVTANELAMQLTIRNRADEPMPLGMGFHPYFPRTPDSRFETTCTGVWLGDDQVIPTRHGAIPDHWDWTKPDTIVAAVVDNCFTGWSRRAEIIRPTDGLTVILSASEALGFLTMFAPPNADFFCAEPISHIPNAFNMANDPELVGRAMVPPGASRSAWARLAINRNE